MREILFRGKQLNGGGWLYGDLSFHVQDGIPHIFPANGYDTSTSWAVEPTSSRITGMEEEQ